MANERMADSDNAPQPRTFTCRKCERTYPREMLGGDGMTCACGHRPFWASSTQPEKNNLRRGAGYLRRK
jgi:hypothetical protein